MLEKLTLGNHTTHEPKLAEVFDSMMCTVWSCSMEVCPAKETSRPVALPRLVVGKELIVVDRSVSLVQSVCPRSAAVVC